MIIVDIIFVLLAIALCVLGCSLLSSLKKWCNDLDYVICILRSYFDDKEN